MIVNVMIDSYGATAPIYELEYPWDDEDLLQCCRFVLMDGYSTVRLGLFYEEQCNMSFMPDLLKLLSEYGAQLDISCYNNLCECDGGPTEDELIEDLKEVIEDCRQAEIQERRSSFFVVPLPDEYCEPPENESSEDDSDD